MEKLTIEPAGPGLFSALAELEAACFSHPLTGERLRALWDAGGHVFLAALTEGRVAGYIGLQYVLDEGYIINLAVWPELRRRGIARALIKALEAVAAEKELSFLTLEVRESNLEAVRLYEATGFAPAGLRKNYYDDPRENALLMTKFL